MIETILVTGATGTVGSEVVKQLSGVMTDINIKAAVHSQNKVVHIVARSNIPSIQANGSPTHPLIPPPNGK